MDSLPLSTVANWVAAEGWWVPQSLDTACPICGRLVNLPLGQNSYDPQRRTVAATACCPGCRGTVHVWTVEPRPASQSNPANCGGLLIYPVPKEQRRPILGTDLLPQRVAMLYNQALSMHNAGLWDVSVGCCRQTLEAIARTVLPSYEFQDSLSLNIKRLSGSTDLKKPIHDLSFIIREGGKLEADLELARSPDREAAGRVLDLTEYLLQYVLTIPRLMGEIKRQTDGTVLRAVV